MLPVEIAKASLTLSLVYDRVKDIKKVRGQINFGYYIGCLCKDINDAIDFLNASGLDVSNITLKLRCITTSLVALEYDFNDSRCKLILMDLENVGKLLKEVC